MADTPNFRATWRKIHEYDVARDDKTSGSHDGGRVHSPLITLRYVSKQDAPRGSEILQQLEIPIDLETSFERSGSMRLALGRGEQDDAMSECKIHGGCCTRLEDGGRGRVGSHSSIYDRLEGTATPRFQLANFTAMTADTAAVRRALR